MKDFKKVACGRGDCKYPIVWCRKYRFRILKGEVGRSVREIITQLCELKHVEMLDGNVRTTHTHLVVAVSPKYSVAELVGFLKGKSALRMFVMHFVLKRRYRGWHSWSRGYPVSTVGLGEQQLRR
jgi:putative transposase